MLTLARNLSSECLQCCRVALLPRGHLSLSLGRTWETACCFIHSVKDAMEKSAFSLLPPPPSCPCPCPEALLRSSCGAFGFIQYTQVPILLLDIVLNGVV